MVSKNALLVVVGICGCLPKVSHANAFLGQDHAAAAPVSMTKADVQASLLSEIMSAMGAATMDGRLGQIEDALRPIVMAMPKNEYGNLGHATVHYALHRLFVQRHGWYVKGLEATDGLWNASSPIEILTDRVPGYIQELFEQRIGGHGLNLREVAVLASTLEHLVHDEGKTRLQALYKLLGRSPADRLSGDQATEVLEFYLAVYRNGRNISAATEGKLQQTRAKARNSRLWGNIMKWLRQVQHESTITELNHADPPSATHELDFEAVARIADKLGEGYGRVQNAQCQHLKRKLLVHADKSIGRVKLADFYKAALNGEQMFSESIGYLRKLGALDESAPHEPSVIVPNYINSGANCFPGTSAFYSLCCIDECEDHLLGHIEAKLAAPQAEPRRIAEVVANLPSDTVLAPRSLPAALLQRLDEIAAVNGGVVPLYGRLFAQWVHHAFPNECKYPHVSGKARFRSRAERAEWMEVKGQRPFATLAQMRHFVGRIRSPLAAVGSVDEAVASMPWTEEEEELLVIRPTFGSSSSVTWWSYGRNIMFAAAFCAVVVRMIWSAKSASKTMPANPDKMYV